MSMMPARISTGSALQPSLNFFRSGSSCATGRCHPGASAPHSAPHVLETSLFPVVSFVSSSPVSPIEMNARGCAGSQELARPRCVFGVACSYAERVPSTADASCNRFCIFLRTARRHVAGNRLIADGSSGRNPLRVEDIPAITPPG